jgi:NAD(P)-dependent dehydrogenase (short-subunit alcohol dehydrogenase family)
MTTDVTRTDLFSIADRAVLLTGASAGIGRRFAGVLAGAGARVGLVARRGELLDQMCAELPGCVAIPADLSDPDVAEAVVERAVEQLGPIEVLVNNAAYIAGGVTAEDESLADIQTTLAVNLVAPIRLAQAVYPAMKAAGRGSIVNVTSMVAEVGIGRFPQATYAASKGGLAAITREWAAQWSRHGVRVNAIAPGFIETEMTKSVIHHEKVQRWITANTLLPRHGRTEDFDGALLFLASDASAYITGQTITVDGGWTAR